MKVVVTGGAGFIGANLCKKLSDEGWEVVAFDDLSTGLEGNVRGFPRVELVEASILDRSALNAAVVNADAVVHLAARPSVPKSIANPEATHAVNSTGTVNVLEAARQVGARVVLSSSSSVYGRSRALPTSEDLRPDPVSPYAASKLAAESYAIAWARSFSMDVLAFRFFNVFGPLQRADHDYAAVVPSFISAALTGRPLTIYGDGLQTRDFTFVEDVVAVLTDALRRGIAHQSPVNLAFGGRSSVLELAQLLETIFGRQLDRAHLPERAGDVRDSQADRTKLLALFPDMRHQTLLHGLQRTVNWFSDS